MFHYRFGKSMTWKEAATKIREEGKLCSGYLVSRAGNRCAIGTIYNVSCDSHNVKSIYIVLNWIFNRTLRKVVRVNDKFEGTPRERCKYIADLFDQWHLDDPEVTEVVVFPEEISTEEENVIQHFESIDSYSRNQDTLSRRL